jgi:hypothetical protein
MILRVATLLCLLSACTENLPSHVALQPAAEQVDFAAEPPSADGHKLLGTVEAVTVATELDVAEQSARNDLRNKAAAMGASLVTIDQDVAQPVPLTDKMKVRLVGRAYQALE